MAPPSSSPNAATSTLPATEAEGDSSRSPQAADLRKAKLATLLHDLELDTGDVVLFDRQCAHMSLYGGAICACAKWFGQTQWDHNAVVIKDPHTNELFLLEATLSGVKMRPLLERIMRSQSNEIAVRKLQVNRTPEFHQQAMHFVTQVLSNAYEDRVRLMFNAGVHVPSRMERERLFNDMIAFKKKLQTIDNELQHRSQMASFFERKALLHERQQLEYKYREIASVLNQTDRSLFENELSKPLEAEKTFCSQLVARLYQHLGILLPYPSTNSYLPKHFSSREDKYLQLQQEAVLLQEISLRKDLEQNYAKFRQRQIDMQCRAPTESQKQQIVDCLSRHPLFHMLQPAELYEIAGHFRPRVLQPGEVVFFQGMQGEYFYFIEQGECDVFVDYDLASQMQQEAADVPFPPSQPPKSSSKSTKSGSDGDHTSAGADAENDAQARVLLLKRRQTLLLPAFQESSRIMSRNAPVLVATNCAGSAFGDSALMYGTPRRATIRATIPGHTSHRDAKKEVIVWRLGKQYFREVVTNHPESQHSLEERHFLLQAISNHPLFANLDQRSKALAVRKCFPLYYPKGSVVMNQGDPGEYFYVIESGQCVITRKKPHQDTEKVDRVIGKGRSFGEATLLYNSRRGASVKVVEDAKLWCMDRPSFLTITKSGSTSLVKLFNKLSRDSANLPTIQQQQPQPPLTFPPKATHAIASTVEDALAADAAYSADSWDTFASKQAIDDMLRTNAKQLGLQSKQTLRRAQQLMDRLLFHDASGLINFSQFVHFHMALSPTNANQLVAEAMFRILQSTKQGQAQAQSTGSSANAANSDTKQEDSMEKFESSCGVELREVISTIRRWAKQNGIELQSSTNSSDDMLDLYKEWFGMLPNHLLTYEDLLHVVMTLVQLLDKYKRIDFFGELGEFAEIIKRDTTLLRQLWMAVDVKDDESSVPPPQPSGPPGSTLSFEEHPAFQIRRPSRSPRHDIVQQQVDQQREQAMRRAAELSFDSNLKTGWISALRYKSYDQQSSSSASEGLFGGPKHPHHPHHHHHHHHHHHDQQHREGWLPHLPLGSMGATLGAGMVSKTCVAPLERLKILMQVPDPINTNMKSPYSSASKGVVNMVRISGVRGMFAGNLCHCVVGVPSLPMKFMFCELLRDALNSHKTVNQQLNLSSEMKNFMAGGSAGVLSHAVLYPLSVVRGRLTTQQFLSDTKSYKGIVDCFRVMHAREGIGAFYRGFGISSLGAFTYIGWNLAIYEFLRPLLVLYDTEGSALGHPSIPGQLLCSATACVASQFAAYPLDLLRRRLQIQGSWHHQVQFPTYTSVWNCAMETMKESQYRSIFRVLGLYRGVLVNSFKAVPTAIISFLTYEKIREARLE